jgi:hypothetical protein
MEFYDFYKYLIFFVPAFLGAVYAGAFMALNVSASIHIKKFVITDIPIKKFTVNGIDRKLPPSHVLSYTTVTGSLPLKGDELVIDKDHPEYTFPRTVKKFTEKDAFETIKTVKGSWVHLKDMYVSKTSSISPDRKRITMPMSKDYDYLFSRTLKRKSFCKKQVDRLIAIGTDGTFLFGHWFCDTLAPLQLVPEEIQENSMIMMQDGLPFMFETLLAMGFKKEQFLVNNNVDEWIFARNLYCVVNPPTYLMYFGTAMYNLSMKLKKGFGVDKAVATQYALTNREKHSRRYITNFDLFVSSVKSTFPKYNWVLPGDSFKTVKESALVFSKILFLFIPTGSNMVPILFMPPGGIVVDMQDSFNDHAMQSFALCSGQKLIAFYIPGVHHFDTRTCKMNVTKALQIMNIAMYLHENGVWPDRTEYNY